MKTFYSLTVQIGDTNIEISEQEVNAQLDPAPDSPTFNSDGEEIPRLIKLPQLVVETEEWGIQFSIRDLHRWRESGCPMEISGCSVTSKKDIPQATIEMKITGTFEKQPKVVNWILTKTDNGNFLIRGFYYGSGTRWSNTVELCRYTDPSIDQIFVAKFAGQTGTWHPLTNFSKIHQQGKVKSDWKCQLCYYNDGNTMTMFKIVNKEKWRLCCNQCINMLQDVFCAETATVVEKYWAQQCGFIL